MVLELHHVSVGSHVRDLSLTVGDGQLACLCGERQTGKTLLLRAVLGFVSIDGGHITIDGELLTPRSAPYFRRFTAYVPQQITLPDGYNGVSTDYMTLLRRAAESGKPLLIVDEPPQALTAEEEAAADRLLMEAARKGQTVLAVNSRLTQYQVKL